MDLVQIHGSSYTPESADAILAPGGMLEAMEQIKNEGLTRWIGFTSENNNLEMYRLVRSGRFDVMQVCPTSRRVPSEASSKPTGLGWGS